MAERFPSAFAPQYMNDNILYHALAPLSILLPPALAQSGSRCLRVQERSRDAASRQFKPEFLVISEVTV